MKKMGSEYQEEVKYKGVIKVKGSPIKGQVKRKNTSP